MKQVLLFLLVLAQFGQNAKAQQTCDSARTVYSFSADSLLEKALQKYYSGGHFNSLLRKHGIKKITCADCDAVHIDLVFTVDENGKIVPIKVESWTLCHEKTSKTFIRDFFLSLRPLVVPGQFAGQCYRYRFGRALKC